MVLGAGEMALAQLLREYLALSEDLDSIPRSTWSGSQLPASLAAGDLTHSSALTDTGTCALICLDPLHII